jgi:tetratricopeptide (TPR) repeat protein
VARLLRLKSPQVRALARAGFIVPQRGPRGQYQFSFQDIVFLRTASSLRRARVPYNRMERALGALKRQLPPDRPLSALRIDAYGDRIVVADGERAWDVENDQLHLFFESHKSSIRELPAMAASEREEADLWFARGLALEAESLDDARAAYEKAVYLDPTYADAQVNLGRVLHQQGFVANAAERYRLALLHAAHATAAYNLGIALEDLGYTKEAIEAYNSALRMDTRFAEAHFNLGRLYEANGDALSAIRHFKAFKQLNERKR